MTWNERNDGLMRKCGRRMPFIHLGSFVLFCLLFCNIRCMVVFLPKISIMSATPGPSFMPANIVRSDAINFGNFRLFSFEKSRNNSDRWVLSKSPVSSAVTNFPTHSDCMLSACIFGRIHKNESSPSTNCCNDCKRSVLTHHVSTLRICWSSKSRLSMLEIRKRKRIGD